MTFSPKRSLGQNFLVNPHVQEKIIAACELTPADVVLEIGPGQGVSDAAARGPGQKVLAIEKDNFLAPQLEKEFAGTNVTIEHADILKYPFEQLPAPMKVVGNLPYNIATPIIEKVLAHRHKFSAFYLTVQLEYGNRIVAQPGSKSTAHCPVLSNITPRAQRSYSRSRRRRFVPAPKVDSCFCRCT